MNSNTENSISNELMEHPAVESKAMLTTAKQNFNKVTELCRGTLRVRSLISLCTV